VKSATVTRLPGTRRQRAAKAAPSISQQAVDTSAQRRQRRVDPFAMPHHPPGVIPAGEGGSKIAQDSAIDEAWVWAQQSFINSAVAEGTTFLGYAALSILAQRAEYRVISEEIASEMVREWIELKAVGDEDKTERIAQLNAEMERLDVRAAFERGGAVYDGLFGRGHVYLDTGDSDDRDELKTPIGDGWNLMSRSKIGLEGHNGRTETKKILALRPVEPVWCYPTTYDSNDPLKPDWYCPTTWHVMGKEVHVSRLLTFIGREVPDLLKPAYSFGGLSMSQMAKPYIDNWLRTRQSVSDKVASFSVRGIKTPGLAASLSAGGDLIYKRAEIFNNMVQNSGLMLLDSTNEEFFEVATPLGGLHELQAQAQEHMASVSRIPLVKLLGITPSGLNTSTEGEIRSFYDWIASFQEHLFRKNLHAVIGFLMLGLWGEVDHGIKFEFKSLWQLDEAAQVAVEKTKTDIDDANVAMGSVSPEEVRKRIAQDPSSTYAGLDLDPDELPEPPGGEMEMGEPGSELMGHNGGPELNDEGEVRSPPSPGAPKGAIPGARNPRDNSLSVTSRAGNLASPTGGFGGDSLAEEVHVYLEAVNDSRHANDKWNESDHPRGNPENSGEFTSGGGGGKTSHLHPSEGSGKERTAVGGGGLPEHIVSLAIPPAWTDVKYSSDPKADLLAVGRDAKGREQRIYSDAYHAAQAEAKFRRISELSDKFKDIKAQNEELRKSPDKRVRDSADCTALIMSMGIRPGGESDTGADKYAYGATTLKGEHVVTESDGSVRLKFVGKKGVDLDLPVEDRGLAHMLVSRARRAGASGQIFPSTSAGALLGHVHTLDGGGFKTKDFRTLHGTRTAIKEVARQPVPRSASAYKKAVRSVAAAVARTLGNTPTVALQSYINPVVFARWRLASGAA
jgi:phage-related protein (TIGR01555 family)